METLHPIPETMAGVHLLGHGGIEQLQYRTDIPTPSPGPGEVLVNVHAAGVNNTDVNTRIGWYSKSVTEATDQGAADGIDELDNSDATWSGVPMSFPRIQGADACGTIVAVGDGVSADRLGERVIGRAMVTTPVDNRPFEIWTVGSECDGTFAQFVVLPEPEVFKVDSALSDIELGAVPCAYSTAEGMLHRAQVGAERVLITGASGGVGSAAIQLAKRRGATVVAVAGAAKHDQLLALGADEVVDRNVELGTAVEDASIDVVVDLVAGPSFTEMLATLRNGGRYVTAGAIAGPIVELDVRTLYLRDLTLLGSTWQPIEVFTNLVGYLERGEVVPPIASTYPLDQIGAAQQEFLAKGFVGKIVLVPPPLD